jgi:hypothetical protein
MRDTAFFYRFAAAVAFVLSPCAFAQTSNAPAVTTQRQGNTVNMEAAGNLAPDRQLSCIALIDVKNTDTPPDLYTGVAKCLADGDMQKAVRLFALAGAYARFDVQRVADRTAGDGGQVLVMQTFSTVSPESKQQFSQVLHSTVRDARRLAQLCADVSKVGPPKYFPTYLVMHGMNAFLPGFSLDKALDPNFDAKAAWITARTQYLKCPA